MTDADELRIIAKDGGRLSLVDRQIIAGAADTIDHLARLLVETQAELIEAQAKRIAMHERLADQNRQPACILSQPLSMSTGMVRIGIRDYPGKFTP